MLSMGYFDHYGGTYDVNGPGSSKFEVDLTSWRALMNAQLWVTSSSFLCSLAVLRLITVTNARCLLQ
jgi:hypothetical protein